MAKLTEEEKQVKATEKAEKARVRAEKKADREANKPPKHQAKLDRAKSQLPELSAPERAVFDKLVGGATPAELEKLSAHLAFHVRQLQTVTAVSASLEVGQTVRIVSGNQKYLGAVGVVSRSQRIRCYVSIPNVGKEIYLFTSDVVPVNDVDAETVDVSVENDENPVSVAV